MKRETTIKMRVPAAQSIKNKVTKKLRLEYIEIASFLR
jgi:hypothetical protein